MPRVGNVLAVRGGQQPGHPQVQADHRPGRRQRHRRHLVTRQDQNPAFAFPLDAEGLHPALHRPVGMDLHLADALQVDALLLGVPAAAVPIGGPDHGVEPAPAFEAGIARLLAGLDPPVERLEGLVEAAQGGLLGGKRPAALPGRIGPADGFQFGGLVGIANGAIAHLPGGAAVLQGAVVQLPVVVEHGRHRPGLLAGGAQRELEGASHARSIAARCDRGWLIDAIVDCERVERRCLCRLKAAVPSANPYGSDMEAMWVSAPGAVACARRPPSAVVGARSMRIGTAVAVAVLLVVIVIAAIVQLVVAR